MPKLVDADQRRVELADAAARVIARSGIDGASLREVAAEAGWTTGALVHYFANKKELLAFTLQASLEQRRTRGLERGGRSRAQTLRDTLVGSLPITPETKLHWIVTLAFAAQASADDEMAEMQRDAYRRFRSTVAALVTGTVDDPEREAERLIALLDGIALQALFDPESWTPDRQRDALESGLEFAG